MRKGSFRKILLTSGAVLLVLVAVLVVHIYWVTRPKAPDEHTRIMARIDLKQDINQDDANQISAWLYAQKGVDHVLCSAASNIAIFTYAPIQNNADAIVSKLKMSLPYNKAQRYMPSEKEMSQGCPVAATSTSYKVYTFFKNIF